MHEELTKLLPHYLENIRPEVISQRFFATKRTGKVSAIYVNRLITETCTKLEWPQEVTSHVMRHSFASNLVKKSRWGRSGMTPGKSR